MKRKPYKKVKVVAKNNPQGSYVAGCPAGSNTNSGITCRQCERYR